MTTPKQLRTEYRTVFRKTAIFERPYYRLSDFNQDVERRLDEKKLAKTPHNYVEEAYAVLKNSTFQAWHGGEF